jgi:hypothetical protein
MAMPLSDETSGISTDSVVVASKSQVSSELAGEVILLSLEAATYYGMDQVGARIWELMQNPARVADLRDAVVQEYEVDVDRCENDLLGFLRHLAAEGLIEVRDAPSVG